MNYPTQIKDNDGIVWYRKKDGSYSDSKDPETEDISFGSFEELFYDSGMFENQGG